jgi:hypothetical protein
VQKAVQADFVALLDYVSRQPLKAPHLFAQHKEGGRSATARKRFEYRRSGVCIRPVIEGKRDR